MSVEAADSPGLLTLGRKLGSTLIGALQNRGELLAVEWQLEKARLAELLVSTLGVLLLAVMGLVMFTVTIMLLIPEDYRLYAAGGFTLLYFLGAVGAWMWLKSLLKKEPFAESLEQARKDRVWLDSSL